MAPTREEMLAQFERARGLCRERRYYHAAELLRELSELPPDPVRRDLELVIQSYLGLAVARSVGDFREALRLAEPATACKGWRADAYCNLALIHLDQGNRKQALPLVWKGLKENPRHRELLLLIKSLGIRRPPPLRFLSRRHPLNVMLGRLRHRLNRQSFIPDPEDEQARITFE
jgi:tetratricopeptide (TPR) repeat protein